MTIRIALLISMVAAACYGAYEIRFWSAPQGRALISPRQRRLRSVGLFLLLTALGLWLGGTYLPIPHKQGLHATQAEREAALRYLAYWILTALVAAPLIPVALLDARAHLQQVQGELQVVAEERRKLKQESSQIPEE